MSSSYRFLLGGLQDADKSGLIFALLQQSPQAQHRAQERSYLLESEQFRYTFIERGAPDEVSQYLLKEASTLDGVVLCVSATKALEPHFLAQLELLQYLSVPLHAVVLTNTSSCSAEVLEKLEESLLQQLKANGVFCEKLEFLRYSSESQSQLAKKLLESLDVRVAFSTPKPSLKELPLRIFLRPRRRTIGSETYYLGTLTQGTISCGDSIMTDAWQYATQVGGLALANEPGVSLTEISAHDSPVDIYLSMKTPYMHQISGELVTTPKSLPQAHKCRALIYLPGSCLYGIDTKLLTQIEARFAPVYQQRRLNVRIIVGASNLLPGSFAVAELVHAAGPLFVEAGTFFTWQTPTHYPSPRIEAVGRVISLL